MYKLINICGAAYSGTTMLDLILGNASDAFSCGEIFAWFRPHRSHHFNVQCSCGEEPCSLWEKIKMVKEKNFHLSAFEMFDIKYLIDSSKDLAWLIDTNIRVNKYPDIQLYNILVVKKPHTLAYSYWKRGEGADAGLRQWYAYNSRFLECKIPFITLIYDEFIEDPEFFIKKICNLIDMPYFEGKENFWEKRHHYLFGSKGVRAQIQKGKGKIIKKAEKHPEFEMERYRVESIFRSNKQFQTVFKLIQDRNINKIDNYNPFNLPIKKPRWYFTNRLSKMYRRWFPEEWHL